MKWCPDCGRDKSEHTAEKVLTPIGLRTVRKCPVEKLRGSGVGSMPPRFRVKQPRS